MTVLKLLFTACGFLVAYSAWALRCPPPPAQTGTNIQSDVRAAAARLGLVSAGEAEVKTSVELQNLMEKYPHAERLFVIQFMGSTLCGLLNETNSLSSESKLALWINFASDAFKMIVIESTTQTALPSATVSAPRPPPPRAAVADSGASTSPSAPIPDSLATSREDWQRKYFFGFDDGSWNVIVGSFDIGNWEAATNRVNELARRFPKVYFYLAPSASPTHEHPMFACYIANVLDRASAVRIAKWAKQIGIAPDAYVFKQHFIN